MNLSIYLLTFHILYPSAHLPSFIQLNTDSSFHLPTKSPIHPSIHPSNKHLLDMYYVSDSLQVLEWRRNTEMRKCLDSGVPTLTPLYNENTKIEGVKLPKVTHQIFIQHSFN